MNQGLDMKINILPAKTWNWLRMNEAEVKQVKADAQALCSKEVPDGIQEEPAGLWTEKMEGIETGMGADMDRLAQVSGFSPKTYRAKVGADQEAPLQKRTAS